MVVEFDKAYLQEMYEQGGCRNKKYRFQPETVSRYIKCVKVLATVKQIEELYLIRSLHFEALSGTKQGLYSVRVNDQYRVEFLLRSVLEDQQVTITICTIIELSNHYK